MNETLPGNTYDPGELEQSIYERWETAGYFTPSGDGPAYCIAIPPANVTGSLHMGHAFQDTIMDALIRYHRMRGHHTLWQAGTDHAGIATQMVVERQLEAEGKSRHDLGRERFVERVWEWKSHSGGTITRQLRRMGASLDWSRERFTMDDSLSHAVQEVFVKLYDEGLIYRGKRLVNWDPVLHTAISDLEVDSQDTQGQLWHIRYPFADGDGFAVVATTRPETMLGDAAVAVHPDDDRYRGWIGRMISLPLCERQIPVIADDYVDPAFGSGCLKITPAHDFNDYEVGQRHDLAPINVLDPSACIDLPGSPYHGLDRYAARKQIVAALERQGLLERVQDHPHKVPRGDRSGAVLEPYLTDQWFVRAGPLARPAIEAVENGTIRFVPESWSRTYFEWMHNIQDWCISRQLWWGHRIPAWYDEQGEVYVGRSEAEVRTRHELGTAVRLVQDDDVLDTWFSSALWPFSTLGWPADTAELNRFYPTNVLVTGFDIIFFWVARMIMFGLKFTGQAPFHEVYVHGLVRDSLGQKMAKSKGNALDPLDVIDGIDLESLVTKRTAGLMQPQFAPRIEAATRRDFPNGIPACGTDALRFTFASLATQGRDIRFDLGRVEGYRNFCNKLWNVARYVLMNVQGRPCGLDGAEFELGTIERWIISELQTTEQRVQQAIEEYRFDRVAQALYSFAWNEYASWYLEMSKVILGDANAVDATSDARKTGTRRTLVRVLETLLRLLHPMMPFITEALWQKTAPLAGKRGDTIMLQPYPCAQPERIDTAAAAEVEWLKSVVTAVRNIRGEMNLNPTRRVPVLIQDASPLDREYLASNVAFVRALAAVAEISTLDADANPPESATALVGRMKVLLPLGSVIDREAELKRLSKDIQRMQADLERSTTKLANPKFVDRAPPAIVAKERTRVGELGTAIGELEAQYRKVDALESA